MKSQIEIILEQILEEFENLEIFAGEYYEAVEDCEKIVKEYLKRIKTK